MSTTEVLTYDEALGWFIPKVSKSIAKKYGRYGVTAEDATQELWVWILSDGRDGQTGEQRIRRWLSKDPQQLVSLERAMEHAIGREGFAEREKSRVAGYKVSDVFWYSPQNVADMLELLEDPGYPHGSRPSSGDDPGALWDENLAAMAADVERALLHTRSGDPDTLAGWLNDKKGQFAGKRKVLANSTAVAYTGTNEHVARRDTALSDGS